MRCLCDGGATNGCKGTMLWFDHAIWFMTNNLERFFDSAYANLMAKFAAFITWISSAVKKAIKAQITFMNTRHMMEQAALEYAVDPEAKILAKFYEAPGTRQVGKFFKPAQFSLDIAPTPSPITNKRRKYSSPNQGYRQGYIQPQMRNADSTRGRGNQGFA